MTTELTREDEEFRQRLRAWLAENLPPGWTEREDVTDFEGDEERIELQREWHRKLHAAGLTGYNWPKEYGGMGLSLRQQIIYTEEMAKWRAPQPLGRSAMAQLGPTIIQYGTEEQKRRFLPPLLSGEEIWCQGYSEPNSGSDLASLRTRAVEDGDDFVINGQKIWTSGAQYSDWCYCLVRTDPEAPKHRGISLILLDMKTPGITIRPLIDITGRHHFNEVFFDDVRVPKTNLLGEKNRGWYIGASLLSYERVGVGQTMDASQQLDALVRLAKRLPRNGGSVWDDPRVRIRIAQLKVDFEAMAAVGDRLQALVAAGGIPGPEASMAKVLKTEFQQNTAKTAMDLLGLYAPLQRGSAHAVANGQWANEYLLWRAATIYAGTNEIQRNIIAERGLGMPR
ncbi:MAG TPA: acyl-CoA dehydrogenase [Dehalococcoidia bacterium]|nr:acyl-CoA dehydrogenase [Dehalococcoidia bacterium]